MISLSAAPEKYYWMRYASDRSSKFSYNNMQYTISKSELFGVRELRGKAEDEIILADGRIFRTTIAKSELLMNKSKEFRGKTPTPKPVAVKPVVKSVKTVKQPIRIKVKTTPNIIIQKLPKVRITKLVPVDEKHVSVKLRHVELPDEDDFTDHDLPHEFQRFARVESSDRFPMLVAVKFLSTSTNDVSHETIADFNNLINVNLKPAVHLAKKEIDKAVNATSAKIVAWALEHLRMAKQLGRRTDLFTKLINSPVETTRQLAMSLLQRTPVAVQSKPVLPNATPDELKAFLL